MRFQFVIALLVAGSINSGVFAQDRDFNFFNNQQIPQQNSEANRYRADAEQAYQRGDFKRVIEIANSLLASYATDNPHVAWYWRASAKLELARQARSAAQIREAINDARQAINIGGTKHRYLYIPYVFGLSSLAEIEGRSEHAELAIKVITPILQEPLTTDYTADNKANLYFQRAIAHAARKDLKAATLDYTEAIRLSPQHLVSHLKRAEALADQGRTREAATAFDEAVKQFPNDYVVQNNRGSFRRKTGDLDGAVADFSRSLQIDRKSGVGYINRGLCLAEQNNPRGAEADFTEALKQQLDAAMQTVAYRLRALARLSQGNAKQAEDDYAAALKLAPQDATLYEERACARYFQREFASASADFAKALQLNPQLARVVPWLALALARDGKTAESQAVLVTALDSKTAPPPWIAWLATFLADRTTDEALLAAAGNLDAKERAAGLCEARYFIGQKKLLGLERDPAAEQFREALATKAFGLTAYRGARYELGDFATH
jgi:tetratricopeptide (TPR) repeat protein